MSKETVTAYIGLGSNLGDRAGNLLLGVRGLLEASFDVAKLSGVYETDPVDMPGAPPFLNMAVEVKVDQISPTQMMARMLRIEYLLGRKEKSQKVPRTIDLDLLFYGSVRMDTPFLILPHPRLHLRNFVLIPLSEIASDFVHPILNLDISTILSESPDNSRVVRWQPTTQNGAEPDLKPLDLGTPKVYS